MSQEKMAPEEEAASLIARIVDKLDNLAVIEDREAEHKEKRGSIILSLAFKELEELRDIVRLSQA